LIGNLDTSAFKSHLASQAAAHKEANSANVSVEAETSQTVEDSQADKAKTIESANGSDTVEFARDQWAKHCTELETNASVTSPSSYRG
jgi:low affinity Fe/Cu permease